MEALLGEFHGKFSIPSDKHTKTMENHHLITVIGKTTISMVMFNSYITNYQRVHHHYYTIIIHSTVKIIVRSLTFSKT
jgi:hypothetical protein